MKALYFTHAILSEYYHMLMEAWQLRVPLWAWPKRIRPTNWRLEINDAFKNLLQGNPDFFYPKKESDYTYIIPCTSQISGDYRKCYLLCLALCLISSGKHTRHTVTASCVHVHVYVPVYGMYLLHAMYTVPYILYMYVHCTNNAVHTGICKNGIITQHGIWFGCQKIHLA